MRIHNLYADADGESHFRDIDIDFVHEASTVRSSERIEVKSLYFVQSPANYDLDWHPAPRRQYIVNLDGTTQITASDGEVREIKTGDVLLVEDTSGKGHLSKSIEGKIRHAMFVAIE